MEEFITTSGLKNIDINLSFSFANLMNINLCFFRINSNLVGELMQQIFNLINDMLYLVIVQWQTKGIYDCLEVTFNLFEKATANYLMLQNIVDKLNYFLSIDSV